MRLPLGTWCVRSFQDKDAAALVKYGNNRKIWLNLTDLFPHPYTDAAAESWIQRVRSLYPETEFVIASESDELIGCTGIVLKGNVHRKTAEIGYWLGEPYWGRGIMTQVVRAMTGYIFSTHDVIRVYGHVFASNLASARVLEKAGYQFEARLRKDIIKDGQIQDSLIYSILRDEWQPS